MVPELKLEVLGLVHFIADILDKCVDHAILSWYTEVETLKKVCEGLYETINTPDFEFYYLRNEFDNFDLLFDSLKNKVNGSYEELVKIETTFTFLREFTRVKKSFNINTNQAYVEFLINNYNTILSGECLFV